MMKPRSNRSVISEQAVITTRSSKVDPAINAQLSAAQSSAQAIRKRRSSINVYDQPSSLNSRLRQLETDMLRLDEDRAKLYDETHSALAQYELKLSEIHAILKSRKDNVEKYVEDMKLLLQAKEEFERQAKLLHEKHDRVHEKFMHRETTISREIKLLKNKFELLEKSRQFRSVLQKSNSGNFTSDKNEDLAEGLDSVLDSQRTKSETASEINSMQSERKKSSSFRRQSKAAKSVRLKISKLNIFSRVFGFLMKSFRGSGRKKRIVKGKSNRVASIASEAGDTLTSIQSEAFTTMTTTETNPDVQQSANNSNNTNENTTKAGVKTKTKRVGVFSRLFKK